MGIQGDASGPDIEQVLPLLVGDDQQQRAALLDERHLGLLVAVRPANGNARGDGGPSPLGRGQSEQGRT